MEQTPARTIAIRVAVATVIFFVVMVFWNGAGYSGEALMVAAFNAVIFAMIYAAIAVGIAMFRGRGK